MTTLSPVGGRRRRGHTALIAILVGVLALVAGAGVGWYLTKDAGTSTAGPQTSISPPACPSPSGSKAEKAAKGKHPKPSTITVDVYNSTDTAGLAAATADDLKKRGFQVGDVDNDPLDKNVQASAQVRFGPKGRQNAVVVAAHFDHPTLVNDKRADKTVAVAIGAGFVALVSPEQAAATLAPKTAPGC